jgi:hypothetical protein
VYVAMGEVCLDTDKHGAFGASLPSVAGFGHLLTIFFARAGQMRDRGPRNRQNPANVG